MTDLLKIKAKIDKIKAEAKYLEESILKDTKRLSALGAETLESAELEVEWINEDWKLQKAKLDKILKSIEKSLDEFENSTK